MIETQSHKDTKEIPENPLTYKIIGAAIEVHRTLGGPGLLESIYESALCHELTLQGLRVQSQVPVEVLSRESRYGIPCLSIFWLKIVLLSK
jgi:GxxExxY protein